MADHESERPSAGFSGERLESWKEIARYLHRQVRTVQRWERDEGLPVHRLSHKKLGSVYAYGSELDAWRAARGSSPPDEISDTAASPPDAAAVRPDEVSVRWRAGLWTALTIAALAVTVAALAFRSRSAGTAGADGPQTSPAIRRYFSAATREGGEMRLVRVTSGTQYLDISPDGRTLYDADEAGRLQIIRTSDDRVVGRLNIPLQTSGIAISRDGGELFLSSLQTPLLTIVDVVRRSVRTVSIEGGASGLALSPDGASVYVAMPYRGIDRIDLATSQTSHIATPACPMQLVFSPDGQRLFASFQCGSPGGHDPLGVLNPATGAMEALWKGPPLVGSMIALSPDGGELFADSGNACMAPQYDGKGCPSVNSQLLYVRNTVTGSLLKTIHAEVTRIGSNYYPRFGHLSVLPGGLQLVDGTYVLDTTRFSRLEALPASWESPGRAVASRDGAHLYMPIVTDNDKTSVGIADFSAAPAACTPPTDALLSWWPGDGTPDDAWSIEPGAASPGVAYAPGVLGQAFAFREPGSFVSFGRHQDLIAPFDHYTVAAWIKRAATGRAAQIQKMVEAGGRSIGWWLGTDNDNHLEFHVGDGGNGGTDRVTVLRGRIEITPAVWHHVAVTATGARVVLYVDGRQDASAIVDLASSNAPDAELRLGRDGPGRGFTGEMDEITIYNRALRPSELESLASLPACFSEDR